MTGTKKQFRIIFLPTPGVGHLIPMVEVAKRLVRREPRLTATVLLISIQQHNNSSSGNSSSAIIANYMESVSATDPGISFHRLPPIEPPPPEQHGGEGEAYLSLLVERNKAHAREAIAGYMSAPLPSSSFTENKPAAVVVDLFATGILDVARELGLPAYVYFASSASMLGLMLYLPAKEAVLERVDGMQMQEISTTMDFPGFKAPLPLWCLPSAYRKGEGVGYEWLLHHGRKFPEARGIIVNTFPGLEPGPLGALSGTGSRCLSADTHAIPRVYPIGKRSISSWGYPFQNDRCIQWLDQQPDATVVYLCFGSVGGLPAPQVVEIAAGLERAGCRFLWALLGSRDSSALPEGFEERTTDRGMVVRGWLPQAEVLAHHAVAGFVTHCGWNSCLEAVCAGVPILAWPIQAEQHLNAFEMAKEIGVAVGVIGGGARVSGDEVDEGLRGLIDGGNERGRSARDIARKMKDQCAKALQVQRDGQGRRTGVDLVEELLIEDILSSASSLSF